ncbi:DUF2142 domain-containing protein [Blastococcus deserti]|uniref:DUF2142 domain-containing protein n=1 Tax=Blastococcus deserti TaxID=2259033 RepID=A0ABW4X5J7_9ACTN
MSRSSEARRWLVAFMLFSVFGQTWALATPVFGVPDEPAHSIYAAAAARGQVWAPSEGVETVVTVPAEFADVPLVPCFASHSTLPAGCAPAFEGRPGEAQVVTTVGHYPPAYYAYAGLGSLVADGAVAVYLMRGLTVLLVAGLLASAACSALRADRPRVALAGLGLATTPMVFFFSGSVNPQAPEIAAAVCLWTSGFVLLSRLREEPGASLRWSEPLLRRSLLAAVVLTVARPLSLLWLVAILAALLVLRGSREAVRRLLRSPAVVATVPVVCATAGSTLAWIVLRDALRLLPSEGFADLPVLPAAVTSLQTVTTGLSQMVGFFGWLDTPQPDVVTAVFVWGLATLAAPALAGAPRRDLLVLGALAAAAVLVPATLQLLTYREYGFSWQGRYTLPLAVGIPLLLGLLPATAATGRAGSHRRVLAVVVAAFVTLQTASLLWALNRNVHGIGGLWGRSAAGWGPPVPTELLVAGLLGASLVCAVLTLRSGRRAGAAPGTGVVADGRVETSPLPVAAGGRSPLQEAAV